MANRIPLVSITGQLQTLPSGDAIDGAHTGSFNNTVPNLSYQTVNNATVLFYKLATLPASTSGTADVTRIKLYGGQWGDVRSEYDILVTNRGSAYNGLGVSGAQFRCYGVRYTGSSGAAAIGVIAIRQQLTDGVMSNVNLTLTTTSMTGVVLNEYTNAYLVVGSVYGQITSNTATSGGSTSFTVGSWVGTAPTGSGVVFSIGGNGNGSSGKGSFAVDVYAYFGTLNNYHSMAVSVESLNANTGIGVATIYPSPTQYTTAPTGYNNLNNVFDTATANAVLSHVGNVSTPAQLISTLATGTAPFNIASTTMVSNLNVQYLNGQLGSYYAAASSLASYLPLTGGTLSGHLLSGSGYQVKWSDGTLAAPGYSFYGETSTGIARTAAGTLALVVAGVAGARINTAGIGVGVGTPYFPVHAVGSVWAVDATYTGEGGGAIIGASLSGVSSPGLDIRRWTGAADIHGTTFISTNSSGQTFFYNGQKSTNTQATVLAMTLSTSGGLTLVGGLTATTISGAGTGLTGTASGLSIGGNAATATTATNIAGGVAGGIHYQSGVGATAITAAGTSGQVLTSGGAGAPTWTTPSAGSGTVTSVSVTTANGVSGTVATATTTPAISLTLGAIQPTSVTTGAISGSSITLSGLTSGRLALVTTSGSITDSASITYSGAVITAGLSGNATTATTLATPRSIYGANFNGSLDLAGPILGTYGGTGVNNSTKTITIGGNFATTGAFNTTLAASATATHTLPGVASTLVHTTAANTNNTFPIFNGTVGKLVDSGFSANGSAYGLGVAPDAGYILYVGGATRVTSLRMDSGLTGGSSTTYGWVNWTTINVGGVSYKIPLYN